jgi:hypothetical protein
MVPSRITNSARRPGNRYLANVKAASESRNSTSTVAETATSTVFSSAPKKSTLDSTWWMLVSSWPPKRNFGGNRNTSLVLLVAITSIQ